MYDFTLCMCMYLKTLHVQYSTCTTIYLVHGVHVCIVLMIILMDFNHSKCIHVVLLHKLLCSQYSVLIIHVHMYAVHVPIYMYMYTVHVIYMYMYINLYMYMHYTFLYFTVHVCSFLLIAISPKVDAYIKSLESFEKLWQKDLHVTYNQFQKTTPTIQQWKEEIMELVELENQVCN